MRNILTNMRYVLIIMTILILPSCLSTARLSDLPKSADDINFDAYAKGETQNARGIWTFKTSNEYYLETSVPVTQETIIKMIRQALLVRNYKLNTISVEATRVTASHGMSVNEWAYVTGVYFKRSPEKMRIYIRTKITQDITGGAKNNLSEKLGMIIEAYIRQMASLKT
jgi:hypothetical protein